MSAPSSYTEKTLADFMHWTLSSMAGILNLSPGSTDAGSYLEAVNSALLAYGVSAISEATDIARLRALALVEAWRMATNALAALYDFSADGGTYQRGQMLALARSNLANAQAEALAYDASYQVTVSRQEVLNDPYRYRADDEAAL